MSKKQIITRRKIATILKESVFTPTTPSPLKVIIDVGDSDYYIKRAIELCTVSLKSESIKQQIVLLTQAISLLAVGKILILYNSIKRLSKGKGEVEHG